MERLVLVWFVPSLLSLCFAPLKESDEFLETKEARQVEKESVVEKAPILSVFKTPGLAYQTVALILMMMVQTGCYFGLMNWLPKIMQMQMHLKPANSNLFMIMTIIGMSLGMFIFGYALDHFGPRAAFGSFLFMASLSVYLLLFAKTTMALVLIMMVVGFFSNGMYAGYGIVVSRLYPTYARVTANSVVSSVGKMLGGFFTPIIGFLMDQYTLGHVMMFFTIAYLFSLIIMLSIPALRRSDVKF